ncbi:MAG TPA: alkane 1-monooxygenase [Caulobacteraceae bacterium]|jgi:alkane 1-monooxygenase
MRGWRFAVPFAFLALAPLGYQLGGLFTFSVLAATPLILTLGDGLLGDDDAAPAPAGRETYRLLPWLYIPLQLAVVAWAGWTVAQPATSLFQAVALTLSCGLTMGIFGFLAAHEMVHSRRAVERAAGLAMLAPLLYLHFSIAHLQGHHRRGATYEDPASARLGESAYAFLIRSIGGQWREAWGYEQARIARAGRGVNRLIPFAAAQIVLIAAVAAFSLRALGFFLADAALAVVMLELFNYVAHYGLQRRVGPDGRPERLAPRHSWNSSRQVNNAALFNMGRHADHHRFSARVYQELEVLDGGSLLPAGYALAILTALVPPLWFRVMDRRALAALGDAPVDSGARAADGRAAAA